MAASVLTLLLLASSAALALAADDNGTTTHLSFFMHDIQSGSDPTAVEVIKGPGSTPTAPALGMTFGDTTVMDNPVTETSSPSSAALGQMQGFYMLSSQSGAALMVCANLVLTSGDRNGSTVAVLGRDDTGQDVRELAVVGGTGAFRMATGYVLWQTTNTSGADTTVKLDVYLTTGGDGTSIDANAPVSPVDGGGGGSSSGSGGSKASSAAQPSSRTLRRGGWAAVAVLVAAVVAGSSVW